MEPQLERYRSIREAMKALGPLATRKENGWLKEEDFFDAAWRLGLVGGTEAGKPVLEFPNPGAMDVLFDFLLHEELGRGPPILSRMAAALAPTLDPLSVRILEASRLARFSVFEVRETVPGQGARFMDLLASRQAEPLLVTDVGLSETAAPGLLLAIRLTSIDGVLMTTGAGVPVVERRTLRAIQDSIRPLLEQLPVLIHDAPPAIRADFAARVLGPALRGDGELVTSNPFAGSVGGPLAPEEARRRKKARQRKDRQARKSRR